MSKIHKITGLRFGRLIAIKDVGSKNNHRMWECKCDCGSIVIKPAGSLFRLEVKSCGCLHTEAVTKNGKKRKIHGLSKTNLYYIHMQMLKRCYNSTHKDYHNYGGRGISVCNEWKDINLFTSWAWANKYEIGLTIERINVNGNYEPSNCSWIENKYQAQNLRKTKRISYRGESLCASEWSRRTGIHVQTILRRLRAGWSDEDTLEIKPYRGRNQTWR